ncbi:MAG: IS630 family transposase [Alphaproteobacteria bacterium]
MGLVLKIFFQEEARFGRINDPRRCWAPSGYPPLVGKQMIREYTYCYGAVCPFDGDSCYLILPAMNTPCMNVFLQELSDRYPNNLLLFVCDGAACHRSGDLIIPSNIIMLSLPPYSPELNPSENNWDDMREKFFKNTVFDSMEAVINQLSTACCFYEDNPKVIHALASWDWITLVRS